jgi:hypothetical protein
MNAKKPHDRFFPDHVNSKVIYRPAPTSSTMLESKKK